MLPFRDVQLLCIGAASVIDTAMLLALLERRNWRRVVLPVVLLMAGAWLYHTGAFVHTLIEETPGRMASAVHWLTMFAMAAGLLIMPGAMLHAVVRLREVGLAARTAIDPRYALPYAPLLALIPIAFMLAADPRGAILTLLKPLVLPYVIWLTCVNLYAAVGFHRLRNRIDLPGGGPFFSLLIVGLLLLTALHLFAVLIAMPAWPAAAARWQLALLLSPLLLIVLFAYFILRYNFMQLVLERTIVYGVIVIGIVVAHRFLLRDFLTQWDDRHSFDFAFVEAAILICLVLAYRPLRQRTAEALRYLMGERVTTLRQNTRTMSLEMAAITGQSPRQLLAWFEDALRNTLQLEHVTLWILDARGQAITTAAPRLSHDDATALHQALRSQQLRACRLHDAPVGLIDDALRKADSQLAVVLDHPRMTGLVLLGRRRFNRSLSDEQVNMVVMLVEQLGIAVNNGMLQAERLAAERRALQNEKLSTLGLMAGSIAHEVKNPLSSIKTIATVLAEDLRDTPHAHDLTLIVGEIDRLSTTVHQLLQFARPAGADSRSGLIIPVIQSTLRILRHVARQRGVNLVEELPGELPAVIADENALREMVFNLVNNAIEAGGEVTVSCRAAGDFAELQVSDTGPGLPPSVQDRLFEPFVTTKESGTGLGLYVVGRQVRDAGGEIHCETGAGRGTRFIVRLPFAK